MARETLTREQIVATAIELLDAEGIDALSMRRLAQRLGSAATSMYWHVGNKENLVVLAGDQVWTGIELPDITREGWRAAAASLARNTYDLLTRHHWLVPATSTHFIYGPGMARYQDHTYAVYEAAGFAGTDLDHAYETVFNFVLGTALGKSYETAMRARLDNDGDGEAKLAGIVHRAEEIAGAFPRLKARLAAHRAIDTENTEADYFDQSVAIILDGLESRRASA